MRAFLAACFAVLILAACGVLALGAMQKPAGIAFSSEATRINADWSWRQIFGRSGTANAHLGPEACAKTGAYEWIFVDLGEAGENDACAVSQ